MRRHPLLYVLLILTVAVISGAGGYWWAHHPALPTMTASEGTPAAIAPAPAQPAPEDERRVLYWYDPMYPQQHFEKPGKSPFMDMQLVPKYADATGEAATVHIDPSLTQNIGMRVAPVSEGMLTQRIDALGSIAFNDRDLTVVQARSGGYVEQVPARAPGDVVAAGATLANVLVPEWAGAQTEFLALLRNGDARLVAAARERLRLLGMPATLISRVEHSGSPQPIYTITAPAGGVIDTLEVRAGMTVSAGQTLASIRGLDTVWLDTAVPEAEAGWIKPGDAVQAQLNAFPGEEITGTVIAVLPAANSDSRTFTVRTQFDNRDGRLRPGMYAQARITNAARPALLVPSEAIIRTGRRTLVMLAEDNGRYRPAEIRIGRETDGRTEVLGGLRSGQQVVVSGQFLIDSEASLAGVMARLQEPQAPVSALHEAEAVVVSVSDTELRIDHSPFTTLGMPGMTMTFALARPEIAQGIEPGERVRIGARETDHGLVIEKIERIGRTETQHD